MRPEDTVTLDLPNGKEIRLSPAAAASYKKVLAHAALSEADLAQLCTVRSAYRSPEHQQRLYDTYTAIVGGKWIPWSQTSDEQRRRARAAGFAYHPGKVIDAPHTHVGGGAVDLPPNLSAEAKRALWLNGWTQNVAGDSVHWAFIGGAQ
jgi:hypothetical protein